MLGKESPLIENAYKCFYTVRIYDKLVLTLSEILKLVHLSAKIDRMKVLQKGPIIIVH